MQIKVHRNRSAFKFGAIVISAVFLLLYIVGIFIVVFSDDNLIGFEFFIMSIICGGIIVGNFLIWIIIGLCYKRYYIFDEKGITEFSSKQRLIRFIPWNNIETVTHSILTIDILVTIPFFVRHLYVSYKNEIGDDAMIITPVPKKIARRIVNELGKEISFKKWNEE